MNGLPSRVIAVIAILTLIIQPVASIAVASGQQGMEAFIDPRIPSTGTVDMIVVLDADTWLLARNAPSIDEAVALLRESAYSSQEPIIEAITGMGGEVVNRFWIVNALLVRADAGIVNEIASLPGVKAVLLNARDARIIDPVDDAAVVQSPIIENWGVYAINATGAWSLGYTGSGVRIAVIDTGVYIDHVTLQGKLFTVDPTDILYPGGWISIDSNGYLQCTRPGDPNGHGTFVASLALGGSPGVYNIGVAPNAKLMAVQAFGIDGTATPAQLLKAFEWTVNPTRCNGDPTGVRPHIVSLSAGISGYAGTLLLDAIKTLMETGVIVVAASGNSGPGNVAYPANVWGVYAIGAVDNTSTIAPFSGGGLVTWPDPPSGWPFKPPYPSSYTKPDFTAPGVNVVGAGNGGTTLFYQGNGTSFATPHIAGTAALVLQALGALNYTSPVDGRILAELVYDILVNASTDLGSPGMDDRYGYGLPDAGKAVTLARELTRVYTLNVTITPPEATVGDNVTVAAAASGFTVPNGTVFTLLLDGTPLPVSPVWDGGLTASFTVPEKPRGNYTVQVVSADSRYQGAAALTIKPSIKAPATVNPGSSVTITLYAHDPLGNYTLLLDGIPIATVQANSNGTATAAVPIPSDALPGAHTLESRDAATGSTLASTIIQVVEQAQAVGGAVLSLQASGPTLVEAGDIVQVYLVAFTPAGPMPATVTATVQAPSGAITPVLEQVAPGLYRVLYQASTPGYYVLYATAQATIDNTTLYAAAVHVAYATGTLQAIQDTLSGVKHDTTEIIEKLDNTTSLVAEALGRLDTLSSKLTILRQELHAAEANITGAITGAQGNLTQAIQQAANQTQTTIGDYASTILSRIDQAVNTVNTLNSTITGLASDMTGNLTAINGKLDDTLARLTTLENLVQGISTTLNQTRQQLATLQSMIEQLGQTLGDEIAQLGDAVTSLAGALQEQGQMLQALMDRVNEIASRLQDLATSIIQINDKLDRIDEKTDKMNNTLTRITGEVQQLGQDTAEARDTASQARTASLAAAALALGALAVGAIRLFK